MALISSYKIRKPHQGRRGFLKCPKMSLKMCVHKWLVHKWFGELSFFKSYFFGRNNGFVKHINPDKKIFAVILPSLIVEYHAMNAENSIF